MDLDDANFLLTDINGVTNHSRDWEADLKQLIDKISSRKEADIFLEPVPFEELGLTDYVGIIIRCWKSLSCRSYLSLVSYRAIFFLSLMNILLDIVKFPIDLGTIKRRLLNHEVSYNILRLLQLYVRRKFSLDLCH